jgi:hypothetical protein
MKPNSGARSRLSKTTILGQIVISYVNLLLPAQRKSLIIMKQERINQYGQ